jgi:hypothetical protein
MIWSALARATISVAWQQVAAIASYPKRPGRLWAYPLQPRNWRYTGSSVRERSPRQHAAFTRMGLQNWSGIDSQTLVRLDHLRKQRNLMAYSGDLIPESAVTECLTQAQSLYAATHNWLKANKVTGR